MLRLTCNAVTWNGRPSRLARCSVATSASRPESRSSFTRPRVRCGWNGLRSTWKPASSSAADTLARSLASAPLGSARPAHSTRGRRSDGKPPDPVMLSSNGAVAFAASATAATSAGVRPRSTSPRKTSVQCRLRACGQETRALNRRSSSWITPSRALSSDGISTAMNALTESANSTSHHYQNVRGIRRNGVLAERECMRRHVYPILDLVGVVRAGMLARLPGRKVERRAI